MINLDHLIQSRMFRLLSVACAVWIAAGFACVTSISAQSLSAHELIARMRPKSTGGFYARLRMEIHDSAASVKPIVLQVQIKGRRTETSLDILYQVIYPKDRKGEGVLLRRQDGKPTEGASYVPGGSITSFGPGDLLTPLFGSDLCYEDMDQGGFFNWENLAELGLATIEKRPCITVELSPSKDRDCGYTKVRSVIDTKRQVVLRLEKFTASSDPLHIIETTHVVTADNGRIVPDKFTVLTPIRNTSTLIEGHSQKAATYDNSQFKPEALLQLTRP